MAAAITLELTWEILRVAQATEAREEMALTIVAVGSGDISLYALDVETPASPRSPGGGFGGPLRRGVDCPGDHGMLIQTF